MAQSKSFILPHPISLKLSRQKRLSKINEQYKQMLTQTKTLSHWYREDIQARHNSLLTTKGSLFNVLSRSCADNFDISLKN